jgi:RNA polymerase-binding protein DksA
MPSPLTRRQIAELGGRLKMRRTVLLEQVREALLVANRERYGGLARDVHDSGDEVTASLLFDINSIVSDREVHELRDVEATLQRIKAGVFGMCIDCGDDIGVKRLDAYPTAKRCYMCQRRYEKTHAPDE